MPDPVILPGFDPAVDSAHATVPVNVADGLSAGQIDILRLFPRSPAHFATNGPFAAVPYAEPPCSGS